jgi:membrane-bound serine protease (ClpP class)
MSWYTELFFAVLTNFFFYFFIFLIIGLMVLIIAMVQKKPVISGKQGLMRETAVAHKNFKGEGLVDVHGELWKAVSEYPVKKGDLLKVLKIKARMVLVVEKIDDRES